jgi:hypothetical protein
MFNLPKFCPNSGRIPWKGTCQEDDDGPYLLRKVKPTNRRTIINESIILTTRHFVLNQDALLARSFVDSLRELLAPLHTVISLD